MMKREPGMVSVVVTNCNRELFLKECLDSLHHQTYPKIEIIFVDDASTDRSIGVVQSWMKENGVDANRLLLVCLSRNAGYSGSLTTGLFLARGEFIAVQDSDDFSHLSRFEKQVSYLENHPEVSLVGSNYASFKNEDHQQRQYTPANWLKYGEEIRKVYRNGGHCVCNGTIMFRGAIFDQIGGLTRRIAGAEDYEFIVKFLNIGARIDNMPEILYYYRFHSNQRSLAYFGKGGDPS
ncbi:glycosyl transferase [Paenibacillus pectinilyticus]|uniref:Glycosyl transferase n=1 Tax=Paenibacillus pectinilyticus TaxID=512399 RepID=A0A1C0ZZP4_9BACL|nr:glycosyltransferase family 2 protein [Paenibacillus pectinilyticus]OCT13580.1 glycosyl transferase [Paenibacillus pectinilyticus]